jgi:hypothetical protein
MRVSFLERAIKPAKKNSSVEVLNNNRNSAEQDAVHAAIMEYYEQERIKRYLRDPMSLRMDLECEQEEANFLRSRGLTPRPSRIPEQFQQGLKKYRP